MKSSDQIRKHLIFSSTYQPGVASYVLVNHANDDDWRTILLVFNGNRSEITFELMEHINWRIIIQDTEIDMESTRYIVGKEIKISGISLLMLVED